jgi:ubiquinone/menaquinone biosynthesis C-methylase UbiE
LFKRSLHRLFGSKDTKPLQAYNLWAADYDSQPDNLMLAFDEALFPELLAEIGIKNKSILDIGCGTGRHWKGILEKEPSQLAGYDVSAEMLKMLQQKFPKAITYQLGSNKLDKTGDGTVDIVISTLTIAHIENAKEALEEWNRVLRPGGHVIITDYHPIALKKGGKRTFTHKGETISVKNHIHSIEALKQLAGQLQWQTLRLVEKKVDETVKSFYEKQHALAVFESFKGTPIIYGILFKKTDVT